MSPPIALYYILLIFELLIAVGVTIYAAGHLYSSVMGAPYVPTKMRIVDEILGEAQLKKGQTFIELGSGDGRVVLRAVERYGVYGVGVDINPLLVFLARLNARMQRLNQVEFLVKNIYEVDLKKADVIYLFLMPPMLEKLAPTLTHHIKPGALVISHGFRLPELDVALEKTIERKPFPTYYYRPRKA